MKKHAISMIVWHMIRGLIGVTIFTGLAAYGQSTVEVMLESVRRPTDEEKLAVFTQADTGEKVYELLNALCSKFKKQDLSDIEVTLTSGGSRTLVAKTDKNGVARFEGVHSGNLEVKAETDVVINGKTIKAKARKILDQPLPQIRLQLYTDWVTVKGRIVGTTGIPLRGITVESYFFNPGRYISEHERSFPCQKSVTDTNGYYELPDVRPMDMVTTARYLVNPSVTMRDDAAFFKGMLHAGRNPAWQKNNPEVFSFPVISENTLLRARHYIVAYNKLSRPFLNSGRHGLVETKNEKLDLPKSHGDVIFLPDIVLKKATE